MTSREFAVRIVRDLQAAGHEALWAGGCVRDALLGWEPKDYDVATSAHPEQIRELFGHKRTLPIGAAFGVITVLGPRGADPIEVATFRRDAGYSDGRRPDAVEFTDAREDAIRRDFTINGMFYNPITEQVIDFVEGQRDLTLQRIRAIGDPHQRIEEDKLRMLRGIRFAATFGFDLERETLAAIQEHAPQISVVSGERVGAELRRMLGGSQRAVAAKLLRESKLLMEILPNAEILFAEPPGWEQIVVRLDRLGESDFVSAAAILIDPIIGGLGIEPIFQGWKLSNEERKSIEWICRHWKTLAHANAHPWSLVQPLLLHPDASRALAVAQTQAAEPLTGVEFCRERLDWPDGRLNPKPFLDGGDLIGMGIQPGPQFSSILKAVRAGQLEEDIENVDQARQLARKLAKGL